MLLASCAKINTPEVELGTLPIRMNLATALDLGFRIDAVTVRISRGDFTQEQNLQISGTYASGVFQNLEHGNYAIDVWVYEEGVLIATGQGTGNVLPAQTTTVYINLQFVPGALEVNISWGLPYADSRRILLIGNSHTYYNDGVDTHLQAMINSVMPQWNVVINSATIGGATLQDHLNNLNTTSQIRDGDWDLVILQEQSSRPMTDPQAFYNAAIGLNSIIRGAGAQTGFYMTWAWRNNPEMYIPVRDAYQYIGAYLDALVIPAGIGFYNASLDYPALDLYSPDNYHPSLQGTYLVACMMLARIWNINPIGNSYIPADLDATTALQIQTLAWQTLLEYRNAQLLSRLPRAIEYKEEPLIESRYQMAI